MKREEGLVSGQSRRGLRKGCGDNLYGPENTTPPGEDASGGQLLRISTSSRAARHNYQPILKRNIWPETSL